jgi:hyperosmotically inducible protein
MKKTLATISLAALVVCAAAAFSPAMAADRPDSWLTMKTKIALLTTEGVDTSDLNVDTVDGVVTLHGKVASEQAKAKAEQVAKSIEGVKQVKNLLQIVPESAREVSNDADDAIKDRVEKAFEANKAVADSDIVVASVNQGVVLLSGKSPSMALHLQAIETAQAVKGVRRVASEVYVESTATE